MANSPPAVRRPTMTYWTLPDGTIARAESENADLIEANDDMFTSPFSSNKIVGRNLFAFIGGKEVRHIYQSLTARVLKTGHTINFRYRCDSREVRREMSMELSRDAAMIRYKSVLVRETPRKRPVPKDESGTSTFVAVCSFCKNYRFPTSSRVWKELEDLMMEKELPEHFSLTHGICEDCYRALMTEANVQ
jgi:hypothetical protein